MKCVKNVDLGMVIKALAKKQVHNYAGFDVPMDIETLKTCAAGKEEEDRFLWYQQRACGTWLVNVKEVFKADSGANIQWLNEARNGNTARVKAYVVIPSGLSAGRVMGDIYTIDYAKTVQAVEQYTYRVIDFAEFDFAESTPVGVNTHLLSLRSQMKKAKEVSAEAFVGFDRLGE